MGIGLVGNADSESSVCGAGTAYSYAYDLAGRRTGVGGSFARANVPQAASAATYNANNQLTQWKGASLTYDANGNLTSDGSFSFWVFLLEGTDTWNARNQLVSISGAVPASFQYDPFGRRVSKTIGGTTQYLYDGANPVQEISGSSATANLLTGGVDEYFQRTDSAGARNFLTDALGSTLALADSTGALQTQYTFEPFGNTSVTGTATTNSFAYTGRELDSTGLYFYRARYYHPQLQRFVSEDPIGFRGGINGYAYVSNSPTNFFDPFGLDKKGPFDRGPTMSGHPRNCSVAARIFKATDFNFKEGLDIEAGVFDVGLSRNVNFETNATTVQAEIGAFGAGFNAQRVTDTGYLNLDLVNPNTEFTGHLGTYEKNLVTGESKFSTSKLIKLGFAVGGGLDFSFDLNKFKELTASCQEP